VQHFEVQKQVYEQARNTPRPSLPFLLDILIFRAFVRGGDGAARFFARRRAPSREAVRSAAAPPMP